MVGRPFAIMRIVQVCPYDISRAGGVARHAYDLSVELSRLGHDVKIVVKAKPSKRPARMRLTVGTP